MSKKVLIAEDDVILREILTSKLSGAGIQTFVAESGDKALEIIRQEKPDLVLLDILIPGKNGIEVMKEMSVDNNLKDVQIIALSNSDDADAIKQAKSLGAKDFLIKAIFDSNDVLAKVQQILNNHIVNAVSSVSASPIATPVITPIVATQEAPTSPMSGVVTATTGTADVKKILIVEDDRFLREIASQKLEAEGFKVITATNGQEALDYLEKSARPDIIVLDLILPGVSGYEVLEKVKLSEPLKNIPILILSNLGQEEDVEKAKKLGAADYLVKAHFSFAEIIKKIREILG